MSVSNVMVVCPACKRPTRVGITEKEAKGGIVHVRVCRRADCGQEIDLMATREARPEERTETQTTNGYGRA